MKVKDLLLISLISISLITLGAFAFTYANNGFGAYNHMGYGSNNYGWVGRMMGSGHMGSQYTGNMMNGYYDDYNFTVSQDEAVVIANNYVRQNLEGSEAVFDHVGHMGYSFRVIEENEFVGMLMIDGFDGDVFYNSFSAGYHCG
jgi:hypothetical protein